MSNAETSTTAMIFLLVFVVCVLAWNLTMIPGFILSALGKNKVGSKLIRFGATCGVLTCSLAIIAAIALGRYWAIALLPAVVLWLILDRKRKPKTDACPRCKEKLTWQAKLKLFKLFRRNSMPCPHCGTRLVWSKWPWRLVSIGGCLCFASIVFKWSNIELTAWADGVFYIALLVLAVGHFSMKLEISDSGVARQTG